jgi:diguanylate cyclase (GGDEF)-like protein
MTLTDTLRILILNDSRAEVERWVSMLRNAGISTRSQHAESLEALAKLLEEQTWDLLLGLDSCNNLPVGVAAKEIQRQRRDIPIVLITEQRDSVAIVEGLRAGAKDVILLDDDQHLLLAMEREYHNRAERQARRIADRIRLDAEQRARQLLENSRDGIAYIQDGMFVFVNQSMANFLAFDDIDDLAVMPFIDLVADADQEAFKEVFKKFSARSKELAPQTLQLKLLDAQDQPVPFTITLEQDEFDDEPCVRLHCAAGQVETKNVKAEAATPKPIVASDGQEKLRDPSTGLPNRAAFYQRLEKALDDSARAGSSHAAFLIAIAEFQSRVVATVGFKLCDQAVRDVANKIKSELGEGGIVSRFADNALAAFIPDCSATDAQQRAQDLVNLCRDGIFEVKNKSLNIRPQIGVSLVSEASNNSDEVINRAHEAMLKARADDLDSDGGFFVYEEPEEQLDAEETMAKEVEDALNNDRVSLVFQPIIGLRGSEEEQYEVLVRISDAEGNLLSNYEVFHSVADREIMTKLDRWVVLETAKMLATHRANGSNTRLIVNLSQAVYEDPTAANWLRVAVKAADLPPEAIIFQLKESSVSEHLSAAKSLVTGLARAGIKCSITNFGCALNPMTVLKHVPADIIKIDGSYTKELQENPDSQALANLVRDLHNQERITIVPFVENAAALSKLWQAGVHYIQGHYLQEPNAQMTYDFNGEQ